MPESDRTVKCPICDENFDPTVAGGWCTNPDCGEWQHTDESAADFDTGNGVPDDADLIPEGTDEPGSADGQPRGTSDEAETPAESTVDDDSDDEAAVDAVSDTGAVEAGEERMGTAETAAEHETTADTEAENGTEPNAGEEPDEPDDVPDQASSDSDGDTETSDETPEADDDTATITCPDCDQELDADANFCVSCGADVQDITPGDDGSLDACPSCDTAVDDDASFCVNCGEDLDAHRGESDTSTADSAGSSTTDETASESAATGNAVDTLASQSTDDATVPDKLVLSVEGRDITVEDGDRIGREIRAALLDAGRPEDEAVRIHREHVRFDRQPDGYYLVDLGDNPTRLNETQLKKGDREPIQLGDELELSGVITMTILAA
ncbi:FHA domain-containing protein [Haloarcula sp. CBA1130]|uniref:double zinc ribbon domain-containing protein n=1 Tax=unclassified Haloarcula TaxID=2624677 RepID=UPI0012443DD4|nr:MULTISPECIES: zinc ribbon domain-containing protein [unclassified Haloarcula]KAA9397933.1 FHA domain-containing protein [Haloarcula sp. CBA1129]KAA9402378.1 FHA domain-containing protein [Haloarcula sp. CBA1130]